MAVLKRLLVHMAGFNPGLAMHALVGISKTRRMQDGLAAGIFGLLAMLGSATLPRAI